ncbi:hypothetical protein N431DRAFT_500616 [Stipitochalara longipes BDJ]|nr:hypothetical protein N431DRAFT_500616 [Stipitochalara longipes BDJ]
MSESIRRKPVSIVRAIKFSKVSSPPVVVNIVHSTASAIRHPSDEPISPVSSAVASLQLLSAHQSHERTTSNDVNDSTNAPNHSFDFQSLRSLELRDPSVHISSRKTTGRPKYVKWGVHWLQPTYVLLCILAGIVLALGHHFYYYSLSGSPAGSQSHQQWAITFGSSFAYLVIHILGAAIVVAYSQYTWSLIRQRAYTIESLDNLFSMTSDPRGLLNWEVLKHGKVAVLMCLAVWGMGFALVTPPATLVVVPGSDNSTKPTTWPTLDWSLPGWIDDQTSAVPANSVLDVGTLAAFEMKTASISPPASNSSYLLSFYGPSLQCNAPNATQQLVFDYYKQSLINKSGIYTPDIWEQKNPAATWKYDPVQGLFETFLAFSAFAPAEFLWYSSDTLSHTQNVGIDTGDPWVDQFGNWEVDLPPTFSNLTIFGDSKSSNTTTQQFWILTASVSIVCILGNASYDVNLEYTNGQQTISQSTKDFTPLFMPQAGTSFDDFQILEEVLSNNATPHIQHVIPPSTYSYMSVYTAFTGTLSGNVTLAIWDNQTTPALNANDSTYTLSVAEQTSHVLTTGLGACQDTVPSAWFNTLNLTKQGLNFSDPAADRAFDKPSWMCRNKTLGAALEDLFQNMTISMLAADIVGTTNQTIDVTYFPTRNIYQYNPRNLVISYSVAIAVTAICVAIGIAATISNGVNHSSSFSAMIATAQNPKLRHLFEGNSLGALPLDREIREVKLRFGQLVNHDNVVDGTRHIGFGFEDDVSNLRKNGKYT